MYKKQISRLIIAICFLLSLGFMAGRISVQTSVRTEYIKGDTVYATVPVHIVSEERPDVSMLPVRIDTLYIDSIVYARQVVDTAAIIADYEMKRSYSVHLFDNKEYGKLDVTLSSQYNKVSDFSYTFVPVHRIERVMVSKAIVPFVSASYSTFGIAGAGGGVFYKDVGVEYQWQRSLRDNQSGHLVGVKYKF